jgi:hypothetical protein
MASLTSAKDNTLYEDPAGALSNGSGPTFFAGRTSQAIGSIRRGLIEFDLGTIPSGSIITSARLVLNVGQAQPGITTISLHRALAEWGEGASDGGPSGGSGAPAEPGDATWIHTFFPLLFWTSAGGDFADSASATQSVGGVGFYTWGPSAAMTADAQAWLDSPADNFGWLLHGDEAVGATSRRFASRESPDPSLRPALVLEFNPPPTATSAATWGLVKSLYR